MGRLAIGKRGATFAPLLLFVALLMATGLAPPQAHTQGGTAIGGAFYAQTFQIAQGGEATSPLAYVLVYNHGDEEAQFAMSCEAPWGVELLLSEKEFTLGPGGRKRIFITVRVSEDAVAGQYDLIVRAERVLSRVQGKVMVGTTAGQKAALTILGESAIVQIRVVSPDGEPVVSQLRLFKVIAGEKVEFASSETGILEARVSPGSYVASAYVADEKLAEERFDVAASETKIVVLTVRIVYVTWIPLVQRTGVRSTLLLPVVFGDRSTGGWSSSTWYSMHHLLQ